MLFFFFFFFQAEDGIRDRTVTGVQTCALPISIEFEVERHIETLEAGGRLVQETRLWDDRLSETRPMRSKEEAHDYRYFPEPDLPPLVVTQEFIEDARALLPELPGPRAKRFIKQYGLSFTDASQ